MKSKNEKCDMILSIRVISSMLVGYGNVFECDVAEIKKGVLTDKHISLVILVKSEDMYDLLASEKKELLEICFVKKNENEPYSMMPINGFVDSKKTSWEISYVKNVIQ